MSILNGRVPQLVFEIFPDLVHVLTGSDNAQKLENSNQT
jgi:hypothetical protein